MHTSIVIYNDASKIMQITLECEHMHKTHARHGIVVFKYHKLPCLSSH